MNYVEYGKENSDVIILLHGGGLSWWNYKEVAERLQTDYHVVLPISVGHFLRTVHTCYPFLFSAPAFALV